MSATSADHARTDLLLRRLCEAYRLDLTDLVVFTEAASGTYLHTPILVALAGARHVYAIAQDSAYATAAQVREATEQAAAHWRVADRIEIVDEKTATHIGAADIVMNTGFVRPIDAATVAWMKPTAVVPLMWETWEFRPDELDLSACRERGILVLGTDENVPPLSMYRYSGMLAMRLLFDLGLEGHQTRVLLLGGQPSLGGSIHTLFTAAGIETAWFGAGDDAACRPYEQLAADFRTHGQTYDAMIVAEHHDPRRLLGAGGLLDWRDLQDVNPAIRIGIIAGDVDATGLTSSGLWHEPRELRPFGYMSYPTCALGPRPVLELFAGGLLVGQTMARARLRGLDVTDAARYALAHAPAMDFTGDARWV